MSEMETLSLRIFGRDLTLACPPEEKDQLMNAAKLLNDELDSINDKNNALGYSWPKYGQQASQQAEQ